MDDELEDTQPWTPSFASQDATELEVERA